MSHLTRDFFKGVTRIANTFNEVREYFVIGLSPQAGEFIVREREGAKEAYVYVRASSDWQISDNPGPSKLLEEIGIVTDQSLLSFQRRVDELVAENSALKMRVAQLERVC